MKESPPSWPIFEPDIPPVPEPTWLWINEDLEGRLYRLEETLKVLQRYRGRELNRGDQMAVERGLEVAVINLLYTALSALTTQGCEPPESYDDAIEQLAAQKVIGEELWRRLRGIGGFRDLLVKGVPGLHYDPTDLIPEVLPRALRDFSEFAREIREWLESRPLG